MNDGLINLLCILVGLFLGSIIVIICARIEQKAYDAIPDDGKPIPNEPLMKIHCDVVHTGIGLYQVLDCCVCPYKEECKKYYKRYKKYPNGSKE